MHGLGGCERWLWVGIVGAGCVDGGGGLCYGCGENGFSFLPLHGSSPQPGWVEGFTVSGG